MDADLKTLDPDGLGHFMALQRDAVSVVTARFYATHGSAYERFGARGRTACQEDLAFHLEFLRPVLEFGMLQPMVDYLSWLASVLAARAIPAEHLAQSLDWLAEFFAERMDPVEAAVVTAALHAARARFLEAGVRPALPPVSPEPWPEAADFEAALLKGDHRAAMAIVNKCLNSARGLVQVEIHVVQPALYQIGEKWQTNQVSVAQEHMATAIVKSTMTMALLRSVPRTPVNKRVLLACVEGNHHDVGLHMVADSFQLAGWDVQFLGANMPTRALMEQIVEWKPNLIGLSVSFAQQLRAVRELIALLGERLGDTRPPVIIGGLAVNRFTGLADLVGANACRTDAHAAVVYANELVSA